MSPHQHYFCVGLLSHSSIMFRYFALLFSIIYQNQSFNKLVAMALLPCLHYIVLSGRHSIEH